MLTLVHRLIRHVTLALAAAVLGVTGCNSDKDKDKDKADHSQHQK